jgi:hypothetical protein
LTSDTPRADPSPAAGTSGVLRGLPDLFRQQVSAYASLPINLARLLASLADAAEASVSLLRQLDERAAATNRVMHSFEQPLIRLADAVDASLVDQTVEALARIPGIVNQATALTRRADRVLGGLEAPLKALGPLTQALDVGRIGGLLERIEDSLPGLNRLPQTEHEVRSLRETLDRMYRAVDEVQARVGALPGAGLLMRRNERDVRAERGSRETHSGERGTPAAAAAHDASPEKSGEPAAPRPSRATRKVSTEEGE